MNEIPREERQDMVNLLDVRLEFTTLSALCLSIMKRSIMRKTPELFETFIENLAGVLYSKGSSLSDSR